MTRDEMMEIARQVGLLEELDGWEICRTDKLEAFTKLVYDRGWMNGYTSCDNDNKTLTSALIAEAVEEEREACAVIAEEWFCGCGRGCCPEGDRRAHDIADSIRARVNNE